MAKFQVLYTKHKIQTRKTWQDGFIKFNAFNRKVVLTSEDDNEVLDSLFLKQTFQLRDGSIFETEKFLVDVQEVDNFAAAMNGAPPKAPPPAPKPPPTSTNSTNNNTGLLKRKASDTPLSSKDQKKRRLGLNRAVMRAGTLTGATEFKQPTLKSPESSASVLSDSADTVSVHEERHSAPSTQELKHDKVAHLPAHSPRTLEIHRTNELVMPQDVESAPIIAPPDVQTENSFDFSLSPSSPDIDFGFLIEPLDANASLQKVASPKHSPKQTSPPLTNNASSGKGVNTTSLHRRVGLGKVNGETSGPKPLASATADYKKNPLVDKTFLPEFKSPKQSMTFTKANRWAHNSICFPDKQTCDELEKSMPKPRRSLLIPNGFDNVHQYTNVFTESIHEELNLQLLEVAKRFHKLSASLLGNKGFLSHDTEKRFRSKGIKLYANCELAKSAINPFAKHQKDPKDMTQLYLTLDKNSREHYSHYAKDDIWIISSNPTFAPRNADDTFFLARSVYHGPTSNGLIEIKPVNDMPRIANKQLVHALHGPNFSLDMSMLENLSRLPESNLPLLASLLGQFQPSPRLRVNLPQSRIVELAQQTITEHHLNEDQQRSVLTALLLWFDDTTIQLKDDVILVHGVYGSGKSHLLVVLIIFLCTMLKEAQNDDIRILVSAATNTAVDRILLGLLELDFTEFIRVGSLKRIAKPVLPFTLHRDRGDSKADSDRSDKLALKELQEMLEGSGLSVKERSYIKQAIEDLKHGRIKQRIEKLKKVRVVGVTCAASVFPVLEGNKFQIVILDESSQMLEPLSMLPIGKFGCEKLLSVGDPMQLPPTLTSNHITTAEDHTLGKTLFTRLAKLGVAPIMLRTQYRLHPQLSKISNKLFYDNQLRDGVTSDDRAPLTGDVPTLLFCNTANSGNEVLLGDSYYNQYEAHLVVELILMLLERGCRGEEIGVIALYKRQEQKISELLLQRSGTVTPVNRLPTQEADEDTISRESALKQVQISTVDAFQGAEKEVIIVSTVRTSKRGFTDSPNRLNVALTRARRHLLIVGRASILTGSPLWREVITQARAMPRGFQHAQFLLTHKCFMPLNIPSDEPLSDTCQGELENDTRQNETEHEPNDDRVCEEYEDTARESRNSPEYSPGAEHLTEEQEISELGNDNLVENNDQEVIDDGQIVFALDDEALISPSPSLGAAQSSELTDQVALPYDEDEQFDEQDEFDLGL